MVSAPICLTKFSMLSKIPYLTRNNRNTSIKMRIKISMICLILSGSFFVKKSMPICRSSLNARLAPKNMTQTNNSCANSTDHAMGCPAHRMIEAMKTKNTIPMNKKFVINVSTDIYFSIMCFNLTTRFICQECR